MADDKLPDSSDESDETNPTEASDDDLQHPAELTEDAEIDDPRDTPDDDYVDDPSTPDINEAKLDRATDEVAQDEDAIAATPVDRRRTRANRPVRKKPAEPGDVSEPAAADAPGEPTEVAEDPAPEDREPVRVGGGRARSSAPVRRERSTTDSDASKRTTPGKFVAESVGELRKVVWPTGVQVQQYFVVVLVFVLFIMTIVTLLDLGLGWLILRVFGGAQ